MIRYRLQCHQQHEFEAWFGSSEAYDAQARRGQVVCPDCGSTKVEKALMSPGVATRSDVHRAHDRAIAAAEAAAPTSGPAAAGAGVPADRGGGTDVERGQPVGPVVAARSDKHAEMRRQFLAMLENVRREVEKHSDYVGASFAEEARKIHFEEAEARSIWGEATLEEARDLVEDGIEVLPLPRMRKSGN